MALETEVPGVDPPAGNPGASDPVRRGPAQSNPVQTNLVQTDPVQTDPVQTDPVQTLRDAARESQQLKQAIEQAQAGERTPVLRDPADRRRIPRKT
jgi:hypothetical protein